MQQRGRKSAASMTLVGATGVVERVAPPSTLTEAQAEMWLEITGSLPADWFTSYTAPLLAGYVRALDMVERLSAQIEAMTDAKEIDMGDLKMLMNMRDMEERRAVTLAMKMRLTQQSSYSAKSSDTAKKRSGGGLKPWQTQTIE
jgi:hypothetical protein